ncbi:MAG: choice-of-anchor P family protein [Gemmatimonadaceae bacterium]
MSVTLAVMLAACSDNAITDTALTPTSPLLSVSGGGLQAEKVKVCKDNGNVPAGTTFRYSVSTSANPVTVTAGQCVTVLVTGQPRQVTISELPKTGFTLDSVKRNVGSGLQPASDPVTCSASGSTGCVVVYYNHKNPPPTTYSGEATVIKAKVFPAVNLTLVTAGPLPSTGGSDSETHTTLIVAGLLDARLLHASTQAGGSTSQSYASVANLKLTLPGLVLTADLIESTANAMCSNGSESVTGDSNILKLVINGFPIIIAGAPNQTISVPGGQVIISEQAGSSDTITVNAIHVDLGIVADVILSQAHADIHC